MKIIDIHTHPVAKAMVKDLRNLSFMEREAGKRLGDSPAATLLDRMDAGGIRQACLMGPNPYEGISLTNEDVYNIVRSYPDRFIGFAGVDPCGRGKDKTREEIRRAVEEWQFKGVGEIGGCDYLAPEWDIVYETCLEKKIPVLVHVGIPLPSMLMKYCHPFMLDELANRHRELIIIAAHAGAPWIIETIAVAARHPNVYIDISALPAIHKETVRIVIAMCVEKGLEDKVLFGTDFPVVDPCEYAKTVSKLKIPAPMRLLGKLPEISKDVREKILGGNAAELLHLDD
jgi:predicted TIM-barrel fold metal-dependent hydrolase